MLFGLLACGEIVTLGETDRGLATAIAVGFEHMCVVAEGELYCQGFSVHGNLVGPSPLTRIESADDIRDAVQVSAGFRFSCVRRATGEVACVGENDRGQLGNGETEVSTVLLPVPDLRAKTLSSAVWSTCAIDFDDELVCWGDNADGEVAPDLRDTPFLTLPRRVGVRAQAVATGDSHTCFVDFENRVRCFGRNVSGELGDGTSEPRSGIVTVAELGEVNAVRVSGNPFLEDHSCALDRDRRVFCWGDDSTGSIGNGDAAGSFTPSRVFGIGPVHRLVAGGKTVLAETDEGWFVWGNRGSMRTFLGDGLDWGEPVPVEGLEEFDQIALGLITSCALQDGRFFCWGENAFEQFIDFEDDAVVPVTEFAIPTRE